MENLEYGDIIDILGNWHLIKNIENKKEVKKITLKDMKNGKIKEELINEDLYRKLKIKKINLKFIKQDEKYYYFQNQDDFEIVKYLINFIGTDFDYIIKKKKKEFMPIVAPVYIDYCFDNIKKGTKIYLHTDTKDASIFYTTDGSVPDKNSICFKDEIIIESDCLIRAIAIKKGYKDSYVVDFPFYLKNHKTRIFLSPSRQKYNVGVSGSGYTNEMIEMNNLCDEIEKILKNYNVLIYRNSYKTFIENWSETNHEECIDLHLAIHSNASYKSWKKGVEVWIHDSYSKTYSLAKKIYDEIYSIYPYKKNKLTNRGIKYAKGFLAETNPAYFSFGINLEVAYNDNLEDALWIINHRKDIALAISNALISYYQLEKNI